MALRIFNTLTRRKEDFVPLVPGEARMYVCGVTVYDLSHIGHARSALSFDVIRRYLAFKGLRVMFVKNFTDVDDRIIRRGNEEGVEATVISERYIAEYRADMASLGIRPPDVEPKATEHVPQMLELIERLLKRGLAYVLEGDVYFEVRRFPTYGKLSGKNLDELEAGARVDVDERKRDPLDFALWKAAKPGEPAWPSPWGPGRPGWHIECSAMAARYLGQPFDIHTGGADLIFPHHENEIAQSEAAADTPFAKYWLHHGHVMIRGEEMHKSARNAVEIDEVLKQYSADVVRLFFCSAHYRSQVDYTPASLDEARAVWERFRAFLRTAPNAEGS